MKFQIIKSSVKACFWITILIPVFRRSLDFARTVFSTFIIILHRDCTYATVWGGRGQGRGGKRIIGKNWKNGFEARQTNATRTVIGLEIGWARARWSRNRTSSGKARVWAQPQNQSRFQIFFIFFNKKWNHFFSASTSFPGNCDGRGHYVRREVTTTLPSWLTDFWYLYCLKLLWIFLAAQFSISSSLMAPAGWKLGPCRAD